MKEELRTRAHEWIRQRLRAPRVAHQEVPDMHGLPSRAIWLPTKGGKNLFAWYIPAPEAARNFAPDFALDPAPAVLVMHGWGGNASMMLRVAPALHAAGFAVLLPDARCHGVSDDEEFTSLPRFAEDIDAGLEWLRGQPEIDVGRLAVIGHSVGAGAALLSATRQPDLRAVVSISAFAHPREMMRRFLKQNGIPYPLLGWYVLRHVERAIGYDFDEIAPVTSMARLHCPVLLVHGMEDETVPFDDARRLQAAARHVRVRCIPVPGGHDPSEGLEEHLPELVQFLQQASGTGQVDPLHRAPDAPVVARRAWN